MLRRKNQEDAGGAGHDSKPLHRVRDHLNEDGFSAARCPGDEGVRRVSLLRAEVKRLAVGLTDTDDQHLVGAFTRRIETTIAPNVDQIDDLPMRTGNGNDDLSGLGEHVCDVQAVRCKEFLTATFDIADPQTIGALQAHQRGVGRQS